MPKFKLKDYIKIKGEYVEAYKIILINNNNYYLKIVRNGKMVHETCNIDLIDKHAEKIENIELYKVLYGQN